MTARIANPDVQSLCWVKPSGSGHLAWLTMSFIANLVVCTAVWYALC